jgi:hypothetical protein
MHAGYIEKYLPDSCEVIDHRIIWTFFYYLTFKFEAYPCNYMTNANTDQTRWNTNFNLELTLVQSSHKTTWASRLTFEVAFYNRYEPWWWWWSLMLQMQSSQKDRPTHPLSFLPSFVISELWSTSNLKSRPPNNTLGNCICIHPNNFSWDDGLNSSRYEPKRW